MTNGDEIDELKSEVINSLNSYPKEIIDELIDSSVFDALLRYKINKFAVESIDLSDSERSDAVSCFLKTKSFDSDRDSAKFVLNRGNQLIVFILAFI